MRIFTPVWGKKHVDLLEKALGRSLSWPRNKLAIEGAIWTVTTDSEESADQIAHVLKRLFPEMPAEVFPIKELKIPNIDTGIILGHVLRHVIRLCIDQKTPLLMATPDFIYGDGTIEAFKQIADSPGTCASIAHMRVTDQILSQLNEVPTNKQLLNLALQYPHPSWTTCEEGKEPSASYHGGILWKNLGKDIIAVRHFMPSPFYVNFIEKDLESFSKFDEGRPPGFGMWDHIWPTDLLKANRLRFIGSSEAAMMIEITDPTMNVPPRNLLGQTGFFRNHFHNSIQNQFVSIFQGQQ